MNKPYRSVEQDKQVFEQAIQAVEQDKQVVEQDEHIIEHDEQDIEHDQNEHEVNAGTAAPLQYNFVGPFALSPPRKAPYRPRKITSSVI